MTTQTDGFTGSPEPVLVSKLPNCHITEIAADHEQVDGTVYKIKEQWHSQPSHLRVIHVGAGAAGLLMAYKMKKEFENYDLVCYEKLASEGLSNQYLH